MVTWRLSCVYPHGDMETLHVSYPHRKHGVPPCLYPYGDMGHSICPVSTWRHRDSTMSIPTWSHGDMDTLCVWIQMETWSH